MTFNETKVNLMFEQIYQMIVIYEIEEQKLEMNFK